MKRRRTSVAICKTPSSHISPTSVVACFRSPNGFKMAVKLPQRDNVCFFCKRKKRSKYPIQKHTHTQATLTAETCRFAHKNAGKQTDGYSLTHFNRASEFTDMIANLVDEIKDNVQSVRLTQSNTGSCCLCVSLDRALG